MGLIVPTVQPPQPDDHVIRYHWFVGIDWGSEHHQVCVLDRDRQVVGERAVDHDGASLAQLVTWLWTLCEGHPQRVCVSIEVPRGTIVEGLIEREFHVFAINPKQLARFRDRHSIAGAKDDRRDAFVLADSLRTDQPSFKYPCINKLMSVPREIERLQGVQSALMSGCIRIILLRYLTGFTLMSLS